MNQKEVLLISVVVFLTIIAWVIFDIYHLNINQSVNQEIQSVQAPNVNINTDVFKELQQKQ